MGDAECEITIISHSARIPRAFYPANIEVEGLLTEFSLQPLHYLLLSLLGSLPQGSVSLSLHDFMVNDSPECSELPFDAKRSSLLMTFSIQGNIKMNY